MKVLTYKEIIDDKIAEWQSNLKILEEQAGKSSPETKAKLGTRAGKLKSAINMAVVQLRILDEQETVENTMETKDRILEIFGSIDKDFIGHESKTPFML